MRSTAAGGVQVRLQPRAYWLGGLHAGGYVWPPAVAVIAAGHEYGFSNMKVKSSQELLPGGKMKAARSVNHRGLPDGVGLWVCIRRPQQLHGPRGMGVRARALRC